MPHVLSTAQFYFGGGDAQFHYVEIEMTETHSFKKGLRRLFIVQASQARVLLRIVPRPQRRTFDWHVFLGQCVSSGFSRPPSPVAR